jgi:RNA-directed DNA polymerase
MPPAADRDAMQGPPEGDLRPRPARSGRPRPKVRAGHSSMHRVPAGSFTRLSSTEGLWRAWQLCRLGKRRHPTVAAFELDADKEVFRLHRELRTGTYRPSAWRLRVVQDPKTRLIAAPAVRDRVVHRSLLNEIGPHFERRYIHHSYTGGPGRGPHRAALQFLAWQRRFPWRLHLDIRHYFRSVLHTRLEVLLDPGCRDEDTRYLIHQLLTAGDKVYGHRLAQELLGPTPRGQGLPLGSYLSQWSGTFYLDGLDHFVKRELKIPGYLRYMDDFVLFDLEPARLERALEAIERWLDEQRGLRLNPAHREVLPTSAPAVFLGYRITRAGIAPSRKLRRRLKRRLALAVASGEEALHRTLVSYRGLLLFPD